MNEPLPHNQPLPQPEVAPEFNPYAASDIADLPEYNLDSSSKRPSTLFVVMLVFAGVGTALVVFCLTFFVTCVGMVSSGNGRSFSFELLIAISTVTALVAAILAVWGILKLNGVFRR